MDIYSSWGGLMETIETCESYEPSDLPNNIETLRRKLKLLEDSKCLEDIQHSLHFTKEERNYLNSPLLDEIFETIFTDFPIKKALKDKKNKAVKFYYERCRIPIEMLMSLSIEFNNLEIIEFLLALDPLKEWNFNSLLEKVQYCSCPSSEIIRLFISKGGKLSLDEFTYSIIDSTCVKLLLELKLCSPEDIIKRWDISQYSYSSMIRDAINTLLEYVDISENNFYIVKEICKNTLAYFRCFEKYNFRENDAIIMHLKERFDTERFNTCIRPYLSKE